MNATVPFVIKHPGTTRGTQKTPISTPALDALIGKVALLNMRHCPSGERREKCNEGGPSLCNCLSLA
jgi:hypothetical protein